VSQTAGTYVCNDVFYALQHLLATDTALAGIRGGFVHVPSAEVVDAPTGARALARMGEVALRTEHDAALAGGAEHGAGTGRGPAAACVNRSARIGTAPRPRTEE